MSKRKPATLATFEKRLKAAGAEILGATNPYELLRFRTNRGVGVIYTGRRGETWNAQAIAAREWLESGSGSLAPVEVRGRSRTNRATAEGLLARDGGNCFFCGAALGSDITIEHLVAVAHGGPNHISNLYLAHGECNRAAGHLSAPEKIAMALERRSTLPAASDVSPLASLNHAPAFEAGRGVTGGVR